MLDAACTRDITDLELNMLNREFDSSSIEADVGVTADSITNFSRHLKGVNNRRPGAKRKTDSEITLRLLHSINNLTPMMNLEAMKEIRAAPHKRAFHDPVTGHRDFSAAVTEMDEMWRNLFEAGMIKPAARRHNLEEGGLLTSRSRTTMTRTPSPRHRDLRPPSSPTSR